MSSQNHSASEKNSNSDKQSYEGKDSTIYVSSKKKRSNISEVVPIYSPRSTYKRIKTTDEKMIADMTLNFDKLTINLLKEEFLQHHNELNLEEFIIIAKKHLKFWQNDIPNR